MAFTVIPRLGNKTASWKHMKKIMMHKHRKHYCEPFLGSGFVFYKMKQIFPGMYCLIGDIDNELGNFWWQSLTNTGVISTFLETIPSSEGLYNMLKSTKPPTDVQRAVRFYYLAKMSGQGDTILKHNRNDFIPFAYMEGFYEIMNLLKHRTVFLQEDYEHIIDRADKTWDDYLLYLDPPYIGTEDVYDQQFDHERLYQTIKNRDFVLSYNDCEWVRRKYSGYIISEYNVRRRKELLIFT